MAPERLEDVADRVSNADLWQLDRRRFLQLAGAGGLLAVAGVTGVPPATFRQRGVSAIAASPAASPAATPPPVLSSVADLAGSLEYDLTRIFRFVADEVRYEPYAGVLRGSLGTLRGLSGNSADQALLLAALLDESLIPYRFATGTLDDAGVQALTNAGVSDVAGATADAQAVLLGQGPPSASAVTTPPASPGPDEQAFLTRSQAAGAALLSSATSQLQAGVSAITTALAGQAITLPTAASVIPDLERTQHVWLQYGSGPQWVDLDPSRPGAFIAETMAVAGPPLEVLPDALRHQVVFHVITESVSNGTLQQQVILDHTEFADALVGVPVTFVNAKPDGLRGLGFGIAGALEGTTQYLAALAVGKTSILGSTALSFGGQGGLGAVFGQPGTNEGETTAEWLELQVLSPGAAPAITRREIFDRVGATARASGTFDPATLTPVQLVDLDPDTTNEFPPCRTVHSFAIVGGSVGGSYFAQDFAANDAFANAAVIGHLCHYIRDTLNAQLAYAQGTRPFCDAPNITSYSVVPQASAGATPTLSLALDIWQRSFGIQQVADVTASVPAGVLAGVMSEVAERVTWGEGLPVDPSQPLPTPVSVGRLFEEAATQGIAIAAILGPSLPANSPYAPETAARIQAALTAGSVVIAPVQPVLIDGTPRLGWWLVDPLTGRTADEMDDGRGDAEYALPLTAEGKAVTFFERMALCASTYAVAASLLLGEGSTETSGDLSTILALASGIASQIANLPNVPGC